MKRLLLMMCMLISISGYAQHPDVPKLMQTMESQRRQQSTTKTGQPSSASSNSGTRTATPASAGNKTSNNSRQANGSFNAGADAWSAAANQHKQTNNGGGFDAFQNNNEIIVDGKNYKGNSRGLDNGIPPGNVKFYTPLTQEQIKQLEEDWATKTKARTEAQTRQITLKAQHQRQLDALVGKLTKTYQPNVAKARADDYVKRRANGQELPQEATPFINDINMAVNTAKEQKKNDADLKKLNEELKVIEDLCKNGLCKNSNP